MDRQHVRLNESGAANVPFVGLEHVAAGNGRIDFNADSRVGGRRSASFRFDARHVLYGKLRPYLSKVATPDFSGYCSTELIPLLPREGVDRYFLAYILRRRDTVDYVMGAATGSRMPRADMKVLMSMRVPLPPLDEQRRFVSMLDGAASIERLRRRAAERLQELAPSLFVSMFGDPVENPLKWPKASLGEIVEEFRYGTSRKCHVDAGQADLPVLRVPNVLGGVVNWQGLKFGRFEVAEAAALVLRSGDILVVRTNGNPGYVGRCAVFQGQRRAAFASYLIRARLAANDARPGYVANALTLPSMRRLVLRLARTTAGNYNVNIRGLASLVLPLPPLEAQSRYERLVNRVRTQLSRSLDGHGPSSTLPSSLMATLLGSPGR